MENLIEYKCPKCGGKIKFDSTTQKMKCPFCSTEFEVEALKNYDTVLQNEKADNIKWEDYSGNEWDENEKTGISTYVCKSCGGEIVTDSATSATGCPFCGNPVVISENISGTFRPDIIIPFKLDKKVAKEAYKNHLVGKKLLPKVFKDENHIDEIKGVYIPFWIFEAQVTADIRYGTTKVRIWSDSKYDYEETSFYTVLRSGDASFSGVPVDGSAKIDDKLMNSIEPFDIKEAKEFQSAYLSGYFADKYDVSAKDSIDIANQRIKRSTEEAFASTVTGYDTIHVENSNINLTNGKTKYALYPVWLLNTSWRDNKYIFAMNGQTGKLVGDLPIDKGQYLKLFILFALIIGAVIYGLMWIILWI